MTICSLSLARQVNANFSVHQSFLCSNVVHGFTIKACVLDVENTTFVWIWLLHCFRHTAGSLENRCEVQAMWGQAVMGSAQPPPLNISHPEYIFRKQANIQCFLDQSQVTWVKWCRGLYRLAFLNSLKVNLFCVNIKLEFWKYSKFIWKYPDEHWMHNSLLMSKHAVLKK